MRNKSVLFVATGTICLGSISCEQQVTDTRPNVLFIVSDDQGYYDMGITGSRFYETPNLDRLASESMTFTNGYATSPVCSPARASLMTGQFAARHGITDWIGALTGEEWRRQGRHSRLLPPGYVTQLPATNVTLGNAMQEAGYKTFFAGKWHLGSQGSWPEDHGFDINVGGWNSGSPIGGYFDPYQNPTLENRKPGENLCWRLADETVMFLKQHNPKETGKPVFAMLSFYSVHSPLQTTREKWMKFRDKAEAMGIAEYGFEMDHFLPNRIVQDNPIYAGLLEAMDDAIGHVIDALVDLDLYDNTIVIYISDQGGVSAGDAFATSNLPLRNGKGYTYEGGLRIPFFIRAPGVEPLQPGKTVSLSWEGHFTCDVPVTGADIYPTILDLIGESLRPEEHLDGISLKPLLQGKTLQQRNLYWHYPHYGNQGGRPSSAIRQGDWKLIYFYETDEAELYNLRTDIGETRNLANMYPAKTQKLQQELFDYLDSVNALYPSKDPIYDEAVEKAYLKHVRQVRLTNLEEQRLRFLSKDFDPGNNWWGSDIEAITEE